MNSNALEIALYEFDGISAISSRNNIVVILHKLNHFEKVNSQTLYFLGLRFWYVYNIDKFFSLSLNKTLK